MRLALLCALLVLLLLPASAAAAAGGVSAFYYPWYGTPGADGGFQHWQQDGHTPPTTIASNYWPARGVYSSSNRLVLNSQMTEIKRAGITDVAVSWWGWGLVAWVVLAIAGGLVMGRAIRAAETRESQDVL